MDLFFSSKKLDGNKEKKLPYSVNISENVIFVSLFFSRRKNIDLTFEKKNTHLEATNKALYSSSSRLQSIISRSLVPC